MKLVYLSTLDLPALLNLNRPFPLYLSTPLTLARLCLQHSPFASSEMLFSMTKVDETDGSLQAFELSKTKKGMWFKNFN